MFSGETIMLQTIQQDVQTEVAKAEIIRLQDELIDLQLRHDRLKRAAKAYCDLVHLTCMFFDDEEYKIYYEIKQALDACE
jgi:hypothetical protein